MDGGLFVVDNTANRDSQQRRGEAEIMKESVVRLDEIGFWSEIKLKIIKDYAEVYSTILSAQGKKGHDFAHYYIDAFAGAGVHLSKDTHEPVPGSPANALLVSPPFRGYYFIDMNRLKVDLLEELAEGRSDVQIFSGDCNRILLEKIFPKVKYEDYRRALCILDPYGLHLNWEIMQQAGRMRTIEIFLNFPVMDMNMNVLKHDRGAVDPKQKERMNLFWGDNSWEEAAYSTTDDLFGYPTKNPIDELVSAYRKRLKESAKFKYVPEPLPMRNNSNSIVYYLFFASQNESGSRIAKDIFKKFRDGPNRLGH
jgi:three-Cys-motif partner protein